MSTPTVAELAAQEEVRRLCTPILPPPSKFSHSRWPYTYACDHYRDRMRAGWSRGESSAAIRELAARASLPSDFVFRAMATAHCIQNNIEIPRDFLVAGINP